MSHKLCPNCNADVPEVANLCKHCFHDFRAAPPKKRSPFWTLVWLGVGTSLVSAAAFAYIQAQQRTFKISIDQETESIVFTEMTVDGPKSDRVAWRDIAQVEYRKNTRPRPFEVAVITASGDRFVYASSHDMLNVQARSLGEQVGRPVVTVDEAGMDKHVRSTN